MPGSVGPTAQRDVWYDIAMGALCFINVDFTSTHLGVN